MHLDVTASCQWPLLTKDYCSTENVGHPPPLATVLLRSTVASAGNPWLILQLNKPADSPPEAWLKAGGLTECLLEAACPGLGVLLELLLPVALNTPDSWECMCVPPLGLDPCIL